MPKSGSMAGDNEEGVVKEDEGEHLAMIPRSREVKASWASHKEENATSHLDQHGTAVIQRRKAVNKRPGSKSMPTASGASRSVSGVPAFIDPTAGRTELAPQMNAG